VSGPYDEGPRDDAPRPQQPSQQPSPQPPQQAPLAPWQQPSQPFSAPPAQQYPQPAPWSPVEPPSLRYAHRSFRSVSGLGTAVSILICLVALAQAVLAASEWYTYKVVKDYVEGPVKDLDRLDRADEVVFLAVRGWMLALLAAGVVFIVWLWRARGNAELFSFGQHRRSRGWVIGGWFCPVVNFWFPKQIVDDVIAASDPRTPPLRPDLRRIPRRGLVLAWWLAWVATMVRGNVGNPDLAADVQDVSDRVLGASVSTVGAVLVAVCAVLAMRVVRLVNRLQMARPWTPWWATDPSTAPQLWPAQHLQQIQEASVTTPYGQGPQQPYDQQPYSAPQMGTGAGLDTDRTGQPAAVGWRFRTPPGWPEPPAEWRPAPGWAPDPQWPAAQPGWQFWEADTEHPDPYAAQAQAPPVHSSAVYDAAPAQPSGNWTARPRPNQGLGTALLILGALVVLSDILMAATAPAAVHAFEAAAAEGRDPAQVITAYAAFALLSFLLLLPTWIVGSLWLSRARENAVLIAPDRVRLSAVWAWLGWWVPFVCLWFPKLIVDDSWEITSSAAGVGARGRYRATGLWWGLWIAYGVASKVASNPAILKGIIGINNVHQGVVPALEIGVAILGSLAFAAWVPVVRGLSQAQTELARPYGSVGLD
jgi:hypothetical protein